MALKYLSTFTINSSHSWIGTRPSPWGTHIWHIFCEKNASSICIPFSMPGDLTGRAWRSWRFFGAGIGYMRHQSEQRTMSRGHGRKSPHIDTWAVCFISQTSVPFDDPNPEQQDLYSYVEVLLPPKITPN